MLFVSSDQANHFSNITPSNHFLNTVKRQDKCDPNFVILKQLTPKFHFYVP